MATTPKQIAETQADISLKLCMARLAGMKIRAQLDPPRAAQGGFPYPGRTCAEWWAEEGASGMTDEEREKDAVEGSAALLDALMRMAA